MYINSKSIVKSEIKLKNLQTVYQSFVDNTRYISNIFISKNKLGILKMTSYTKYNLPQIST